LTGWPSAQALRRLGRNINGYLGETIQIHEVLSDCLAAARAHGWTVEDIPAAPNLNLVALNCRARAATQGILPAREAGAAQRRVYISTGIHGDEPAGPLAVRHLLRANEWPAGFEYWLCPCLNPAGFAINRRENAEGLDLNRQYLHPEAAETRAHIAWLERQPGFDLCLCLHEDWESHGFYVYELNADNRPSLAEAMVQAVAQVCPIDLSQEIEGRAARRGIIRPSFDPRTRPQWPEAFFLLTYKTRLSYTMEAPSDFPLAARVAALAAGVNAALGAFSKMTTST
jgi:predicted deacylase